MYNYINISYRGIQGETAKMEGVVKKYRLSIYILTKECCQRENNHIKNNFTERSKRNMRKKFKRYAGAGMAAALFLAAVPIQPVSGADLANRESVVESETGIGTEAAGSVEDYQDESTAFSTAEEDIAENGQAGVDSEDVTATFTDPNFLSEVRKALNLGESEPITKSACAAVTELRVNGMNIKTLAGIENFTGLKELFCRENQLTELDLTKCTQLERLECHDNPIKTLDVSQCPNLRSLNFNGCDTLTELDITKCPNLTSLWCGSGLTAIDLSKCPKLQMFGCRRGQLTSLDVSG